MRRCRPPFAWAQSSRHARTCPLRLEPLESRDIPSTGPDYCLLPPFTGRPEPVPAAPTGARAYPPDLSQTFLLHSQPTASHVIYLDFDGHTAFGTKWNTDTGVSHIGSGEFDPAGNGYTFTDSELERI